MIKLWGRPSSVNVQKVLWALEELSLPYDNVVIGGPHGGNDRPDFAALTPVRRVPVIEDGDVSLWESHAIVRHLARRYGGVIAPADADWPIADQWMDYTTSTVQPPFIGLFWQKVRTLPEYRSEALEARHQEGFFDALEPLEGRLAKSDWLAGPDFSMADIAVGTLFYRATDICEPFADRPNLEQWYVRLIQRPAYQRAVMTSYDELRV